MKFVALLRGINVGGRNKIPMATLRETLEIEGFQNVETYIQSGNILLDAKSKSTNKVANSIKNLIKAEFGFDVPVVVRDAIAFLEAASNNPLLQKSGKNISSLYTTFLHTKPAAAKLKSLTPPGTCPDRFAVGQQIIYVECKKGYSDTRLQNGFFEKKLGVGCTTRNWKTVSKLKEMIQTGT